jgi:hypothetical protein
VLTPRRVALAAAEACWEGLLGLPPVKRVRLAGVLVARALGTDSSLFSLSHTLGGLGGGRHCRLSVSFSSVRSRVRSSSQVGERKVREVVEIRYSPHNETTEIARTWHAGCLRHETSLQMNKVLEYIQLHTFDYHTQHIFRLYVHHARCMSLHEPD